MPGTSGEFERENGEYSCRNGLVVNVWHVEMGWPIRDELALPPTPQCREMLSQRRQHQIAGKVALNRAEYFRRCRQFVAASRAVAVDPVWTGS